MDSVAHGSFVIQIKESITGLQEHIYTLTILRADMMPRPQRPELNGWLLPLLKQCKEWHKRPERKQKKSSINSLPLNE